jgi:hypothetical protein
MRLALVLGRDVPEKNSGNEGLRPANLASLSVARFGLLDRMSGPSVDAPDSRRQSRQLPVRETSRDLRVLRSGPYHRKTCDR